MLNVNALQKTLSAMSLPEIQKYASLHKNDPYVVAMAMSVANTKKQAITAQQGLAGMQPQPKVVDQDIAQIAPAPAMSAAQLPEDIGIAQLPAQNMQGMAGGGIVAFDEGGGVSEGYWDPNSGEYIINEKRDTRGFGDKFLDAINWKKGLSIDPAGGMRKPATTQVQPAQTAAPFTVTSPEPTGNVAGSRRTPLELAKAAAKADTGSQARADESPLAKLTPATPGAGKAAATPAAQAGLGSIAEYAKEANAYAGESPLAKQLERIDKQEAAAAGEKKDAFNMALLKAGLGMMAGTSRHAFENIGKGAMMGAEEYGAVMKDLKKASLERDKMRDAAEAAEYAYKRDDVKGYRDAKEKEANRAADLLKTQMTVAGHLKAAGITAGAQRGLMEALGSAPADSALRKGFDLQTLKAHAASLQDNWSKLAFPNGMRNEEFLKTYPDAASYIQANMAAMGASGGNQFINIPDNQMPAAVRKRPN